MNALALRAQSCDAHAAGRARRRRTSEVGRQSDEPCYPHADTRRRRKPLPESKDSKEMPCGVRPIHGDRAPRTGLAGTVTSAVTPASFPPTSRNHARGRPRPNVSHLPAPPDGPGPGRGTVRSAPRSLLLPRDDFEGRSSVRARIDAAFSTAATAARPAVAANSIRSRKSRFRYGRSYSGIGPKPCAVGCERMGCRGIRPGLARRDSGATSERSPSRVPCPRGGGAA